MVDLLDDDGLIDLRPRHAARPVVPAVHTEPAVPAVPATSVQGLCALCGAKPARSACRACGRGVCAADTWAILGVCRDCARGRP